MDDDHPYSVWWAWAPRDDERGVTARTLMTVTTSAFEELAEALVWHVNRVEPLPEAPWRLPSGRLVWLQWQTEDPRDVFRSIVGSFIVRYVGDPSLATDAAAEVERWILARPSRRVLPGRDFSGPLTAAAEIRTPVRPNARYAAGASVGSTIDRP